MQIELFRGKHKWFWHLRARNGQVVLVSESYYSKWNAKRSAKRVADINRIPLKVS